MFIEDDELRTLYQTASAEHLQKLEAGLLTLERDSQNLEPLTELLREAHSLKGDSRMLGVKDVESLIHQIEHTLQQVQKGEQDITGGLSDRLYQGIDAIKLIVQEAVTGQPSGVDTFRVLAILMGADPSPVAPESVATAAPTPPPPAQDISSPTPTPQPLTPQPPPSSSPTSEPSTPPPEPKAYSIETIRVATDQLDHLMTQTGELTVTKVQTAHVASEVANLLAIWEEWKTRGEAHNPLLMEQWDERLTQLKTAAQDNAARLEAIANTLDEQVRTLRLLPLENIFQLFPRLVRDLAKQEGKQVNLLITGEDTTADKRILEEIKDPLIHLLRNAIDHGIETPQVRKQQGKPAAATLRLTGRKTTSHVIIEVQDDGRGLDGDRIRQTALQRGLVTAEDLASMTPQQVYNLIFLPGFSTQTLITEVSGRGVGLDVVKTNVEHLKGSIQVDSTLGKGTQFQLQLGTTLATAHVLLIQLDGLTHALPIEYVETSILIEPEEIFMVDGTRSIAVSGQPISVADLDQLLHFTHPPNAAQTDTPTNLRPCVLLRVGDDRFGIFVDRLLDTQDVVLKPQSQILQAVRTVAGATILGTGEVCIILHPPDLLQAIQTNRVASHSPVSPAASLSTRKPLILLTEDSITIRTQEKRILESAGYDVVTAVDGLDGFTKLRTRPFDAVISDVQMPNLDGLQLTQRIRQLPEYNDLPIILVTSLASEDDRRRGAEAGANAYITKGTFNQEVLLDTLERLV